VSSSAALGQGCVYGSDAPAENLSGSSRVSSTTSRSWVGVNWNALRFTTSVEESPKLSNACTQNWCAPSPTSVNVTDIGLTPNWLQCARSVASLLRGVWSPRSAMSSAQRRPRMPRPEVGMPSTANVSRPAGTSAGGVDAMPPGGLW
jgi:hypothetical protein